MKQRLLFTLLAVFLVLSILPAAGAVDVSYKSWSQGDSRWGSKSIAANQLGHSMSKEGCLVTAIAKIMVHAGQQDPAKFTPEECRKALLDTGMLSNNGGIFFGNYNNTFLPTYAPELRHETSPTHAAWSKSTAVKNISDKISVGYYVIVCVNNKASGNTHWMAVDYVSDDLYVMDNGGVVPLYGTTKYSGGVIDQVYFKYSGSKPYPAFESGASTPVPTPRTLTISPTSEPGEHREVGSSFYFRGSITSNYNITSVTVQVRGADNSTVVMEKTVTPNKKTVDILNDGLDSLKFGSLQEGNYYLWLLAKDSSGQEASWNVHFSVGNPADSVPTVPDTSNETKTQYRYHHYIDSKGNVSLCPYYGGALFKSTMTLEYTDWLDAPLTKNSSSSGHTHQQQGSACINAGCIDPTRSTERYTDGSSNWYYEETRLVPVETTEPETPKFSDVPADAWYATAVSWAASNGYVAGVGDGTFRPDETCTEVQILTFLWVVEGRPEAAEAPVTVASWAQKAVNWAYERGMITKGFIPELPCSRGTAVYFLWNVFGFKRGAPDAGFSDTSSTDDVNWAVSEHIISGYPDRTFRPSVTCTRGMIATLLYYAYNPTTRSV